jgi:hypothetical protein
MSNTRLFLTVLLVALLGTYVIVDWLHEIESRSTTLETYDDAEARAFMRACDGHVRIHTRALKHWLRCYAKKESKNAE